MNIIEIRVWLNGVYACVCNCFPHFREVPASSFFVPFFFFDCSCDVPVDVRWMMLVTFSGFFGSQKLIYVHWFCASYQDRAVCHGPVVQLFILLLSSSQQSDRELHF